MKNGNWEVILGRDGFILRHVGENVPEYHFIADTNGWVSVFGRGIYEGKNKCFSNNVEPGLIPVRVKEDA